MIKFSVDKKGQITMKVQGVKGSVKIDASELDQLAKDIPGILRAVKLAQRG